MRTAKHGSENPKAVTPQSPGVAVERRTLGSDQHPVFEPRMGFNDRRWNSQPMRGSIVEENTKLLRKLVRSRVYIQLTQLCYV